VTGIKKNISTNTSAYCQARSRLEQTYLDEINLHVCREIQGRIEPEHLWFGRHVKVVDGTTLSMPDTHANQALYPQPSGQKKGCGFPVMKWVATFSLVTGALLDSRRSNLNVHERHLWHAMWDDYEPGDVVLADCGFCSMADYYLLSEKRVDSVMRLHQARKKDVGIIKELATNDWLVQWQKQKKKDAPKWVTQEQWDRIPESITVRYVTTTIEHPGFRTKTVTLATTLLDNKKFPAEALADIYRKRWLVELFLRNIKTTMRMDILHCQTPGLIHKEFTVFSISYNLIRSLIWEASLKRGINPYRISFRGAMATIRQWLPILPSIEAECEKEKFIEALLKILAKDTVPIRERKRQPRAIKRRPKNFQLLTKPRNEFMEIPHRHKYKKNLKQPLDNSLKLRHREK
jgi:hypothetical protein